MTSRERLLTVLKGEIPDRVPVSFFVQEEFLSWYYPGRKKIRRLIGKTKSIMIKEVIALVNFESLNFAESLKDSLNECISHTKGEIRLRTFIRSNIPKLPNIHGEEIKKIRQSIDCSQSIFAEILGVSKKTVEYWESGKNIPNGSAQRLLALLKNKKVDFIKEDLQKIGLQIR